MKKIIIIGLLLSLVGCSTTKVIVVPKLVSVKLPDSLLTDCKLSPPPEQDLYQKASYPVKEKLMLKALLDNYDNIKACNIQLKSAREYQKMQVDLINQTQSEFNERNADTQSSQSQSQSQ